MLRKVIEIDGRQVSFKASAAIPRIYRLKFGRDIFKDLERISKGLKKAEKARAAKEEGGEFSHEDELPIDDLELFENASYVMAKHADPAIPDSIEDWLDGFDTFSIYQVLPQILELWQLNTQTDVENKKKISQLSEK